MTYYIEVMFQREGIVESPNEQLKNELQNSCDDNFFGHSYFEIKNYKDKTYPYKVIFERDEDTDSSIIGIESPTSIQFKELLTNELQQAFDEHFIVGSFEVGRFFRKEEEEESEWVSFHFSVHLES